ncbi:MAG TPA: DUF2442 domain-containing protein [Tichowtungia sp.]|nr:DUF2442 domain-containing protein [Tichowtungia sp.]
MSGNEFISVENITPFAVWVFDGKKEYAIPFSEFPCLGKVPVEELMHPTLTHGFHLRWENLDIDIDLNSLDHLEDFPIYFDSIHADAHSKVAEESAEYKTKKDDE